MGGSPDDRHRGRAGNGYWWLWTSSALSNLADGVFKIALPLVAVQVTRSPVLIAGLAFAVTLPWLLFALPAGALVDRVYRRLAMVGANGVRVVLLGVLALAALRGGDSIWLLYVVAFGVGVTETVYDTSAQSIVPQVVGRDRLSRANGRLYAAELTANQFAGPPLGGVLAAAGAALAFAAPAALWIVATGALLLVRGRFRVERDVGTTLRADIGEGLRFLWHNGVLRRFAVMVGVCNIATNAMFGVLVLHAVGPESAMGLSEEGFGLLLTTTAAGGLVGSLVAERIERALGRSRSLVLAVLATVALVGSPAVTANPFVLGGAFFLGGLGVVVWNVVTVSLRQRITPDRLLGRLNSAYRLAAWGTMPLGALAGGLLAQFFGLRSLFVVAGLLTLVVVVIAATLRDAVLDAAEADSEHSGACP